jgi:YggT family protein
MAILGQILYRAIQLLSLIVVLNVILSYFMSPFDPIKQTLDRFIEPFLRPIRRVVPPYRMIDFSPVILIILLQILGAVVRSIFASF